MIVSFDGWYAVDWPGIMGLLTDACKAKGVSIALRHIGSVFKSAEDIEKYKKPFLSDDPGFGVVNTAGKIADIVDAGLSGKLILELTGYKTAGKGGTDVIVVYG